MLVQSRFVKPRQLSRHGSRKKWWKWVLKHPKKVGNFATQRAVDAVFSSPIVCGVYDWWKAHPEWLLFLPLLPKRVPPTCVNTMQLEYNDYLLTLTGWLAGVLVELMGERRGWGGQRGAGCMPTPVGMRAGLHLRERERARARVRKSEREDGRERDASATVSTTWLWTSHTHTRSLHARTHG